MSPQFQKFKKVVKEKFGEKFGKEIKGIFQDEVNRGPLFNGFFLGDKDCLKKVPYTYRLFEEFKKIKKYDLKERLPELYFRYHGENFSKVAYDFVDVLMRMLLANFTVPYGKWCKDKSNILNHQIFQELFRKLFSKSLFEPASVGTFATFVSRLRRTVFVIADAKVGIISKRANIFELFLSFFSKKLLFGPIYLLYIRPVVVISSRRTPRPHAMGPRHRPDGRRKNVSPASK